MLEAVFFNMWVSDCMHQNYLGNFFKLIPVPHLNLLLGEGDSWNIYIFVVMSMYAKELLNQQSNGVTHEFPQE